MHKHPQGFNLNLGGSRGSLRRSSKFPRAAMFSSRLSPTGAGTSAPARPFVPPCLATAASRFVHSSRPGCTEHAPPTPSGGRRATRPHSVARTHNVRRPLEEGPSVAHRVPFAMPPAARNGVSKGFVSLCTGRPDSARFCDTRAVGDMPTVDCCDLHLLALRRAAWLGAHHFTTRFTAGSPRR